LGRENVKQDRGVAVKKGERTYDDGQEWSEELEGYAGEMKLATFGRVGELAWHRPHLTITCLYPPYLGR